MYEVLVNRLGGLSLPRKSVVRLTDRPDMTDVYRGRKTTMQQQIILFVRYFRLSGLLRFVVNCRLSNVANKAFIYMYK